VNLHESLRLPQVEADLVTLESLLAKSVIFGDEYLDAVTTHLIYAGGKRLRPVLAVTAATGGAHEATERDLLGGVSVELMHLASLYHDDVMDEATIRRNVESVNARYGNLIAIVAGDYLMARSAAIAAELGTEIAALLAATLAGLTRGQVAEVRTCFDVERDEANYYAAIEGKTATLMAASCRVGAITAGRPRDQVDALTEFGRLFGLLFQLRDDALDVAAQPGELGKPLGQDLAEGIYTLPTLLALRDAQCGAELRELLGKPLDDQDRERARKLVVSTDGVAQTASVAATHVDLAIAALDPVPEPELRRALGDLAHGLMSSMPQ
jgi:heptaprenyl diphosphate synthase